MRRSAMYGVLSILVALSTLGCTGGVDPVTTLRITTTPDFDATVASVANEVVISPAGQHSQTNVWVVIPPATSTNAAVIVPNGTPVYLQRASTGVVVSSTADAIMAGDHVRVWHDEKTSFGAVEAPPNAPAYSAIQVVIVR